MRIVYFIFFLGLSAWADDDRLLDLEARVEVLQSELNAVKNLAEQERPNAFNPRISVIGDILGQFVLNKNKNHSHADPSDHNHDAHNGVIIRELEFELSGEIDPFAEALIAFSVGQHGPHDIHAHVEEAYLTLKPMPFGIATKLGHFKTAFGRMNRIHLHNIPQISYPVALKAFLGNEGYAAPGFSLNRSYAFDKSALSIFVEGVMGFKAEVQKKGAEKMPNLVAHAWWHQELSDEHFFDLGLSALVGRRGKAGSGALALFGTDIHYSFVPGSGQDPIFLFGSELFASPQSSSKWTFGNFSWVQARLIGSTFAGIRWDLAPHEEEHYQHALGAYIGFYTTEFLRFRLGYEHVMPKLSSFSGDHRLMLSMNFVLGAHPVEPYFVNR
jgi:hypothetical protein